MKKILIALILVAIVFSVCSCSKTKKGVSVTTEAPSATEIQEPTVTFPSDDKTTTDKNASSSKNGSKDKTTAAASDSKDKKDSKSEKQNNSNKKSESGKTTTEKQTTTKKVEVNTPSSKNETPIIPID